MNQVSRTKIVEFRDLDHGPWTFELGKWCPGAEFDAYPQRQFVTESININSSADHHIWSTIKTLPATLPEPSFMDRGPRTGVTGAVSIQNDFGSGIGSDVES